jgi:DNA-binding NarL/FixJ family response regulator
MVHSRILVADDHPLMRDALIRTIAGAIPDGQFMEAASLTEALDALAAVRTSSPIDLVLLDLRMPGMNGFSGLLTMRAEFPETAIIVVSACEDPVTIGRATAYGAAGFIPKSAAEDVIAETVGAVLQGEEGLSVLPEDYSEARDEVDFRTRLASLTPQQLRVLLFIAQGKLNKQISYEMRLTEATVKGHVTCILRKLKVLSRTQAAIMTRRFSLEPAD